MNLLIIFPINLENYFLNSYLSPNYINFLSKYNLASSLGSRTMISLNNNGENDLSKLNIEKIY